MPLAIAGIDTEGIEDRTATFETRPRTAQAAEDLVGDGPPLWTYARLVRALRPVVAEQMTSSGP